LKHDDFDYDLRDLAPDCPDFDENQELLERLIELLATELRSQLEILDIGGRVPTRH
jgi:hypothetical protein